MASPSSGSVHQNLAEFVVPEGWTFVSKTNKKGKIVKYYTNSCGQKFYNKSNLMRYIRYSKESEVSIYEPPEPLTQRKENEGCHNAEFSHARLEEPLNEDEVECAKALLEIHRPRNVARRASRRLSGRQPELQVDFYLNRGLEYIIKDDKRQR